MPLSMNTECDLRGASGLVGAMFSFISYATLQSYTLVPDSQTHELTIWSSRTSMRVK